MSKIIRRTITITLTESFTFSLGGVNEPAVAADDVASNRSINPHLPVGIEDEEMQKEPTNSRQQIGNSRRPARTLSQTRSRRRRKSSSPLPKMDS
ncbi:MAG: hypothetical protein U0175_31625 [Caldilineaceae bacterium]